MLQVEQKGRPVMAMLRVKWTAADELIEREILESGDAEGKHREFAVDLTEASKEQRQKLVEFGLVKTDLAGTRVGPLDISTEQKLLHPDWSGLGRYGMVDIPLDAQPSLDEALSIYAAKLKRAVVLDADKKAQAQAEKERKAKREAEAKERAAVGQKERERREAAKALAQAEKLTWCQTHGSEHLRMAVEAGYDCARLYATGRAAAEYPGYELDFDDQAEWKSRSCPSADALAEALRIDGEVFWLTAPARNDDEPDEYWYGEEFAPHEAVVVRRFLGRYDLVRSF